MQIKLSYEAFRQSANFKRANGLAAKAGKSAKTLFAMLVEALNQAFGGMEGNEKYTTEQLFEPEVWQDMTDGPRRSLGICLSYLVGSGLVPLDYANKPTVTNKRYRPKPGIDTSLYSFRVC
jgi:GTPase involved in cell partitioning and DNA repair